MYHQIYTFGGQKTGGAIIRAGAIIGKNTVFISIQTHFFVISVWNDSRIASLGTKTMGTKRQQCLLTDKNIMKNMTKSLQIPRIGTKPAGPSYIFSLTLHPSGH